MFILKSWTLKFNLLIFFQTTSDVHMAYIKVVANDSIYNFLVLIFYLRLFQAPNSWISKFK
jgi:hypothetical protein